MIVKRRRICTSLLLVVMARLVTDGQTDRQADRQKQRLRDREGDRDPRQRPTQNVQGKERQKERGSLQKHMLHTVSADI